MALPTIQVRVAFASDPYDAAPVWTDITHDVQNISIKRGRQTELNRMEAGTARIQLKNFQGNYWPNNAAGLYYPNILPGKKVNIRAYVELLGYDGVGGFSTPAVDWIRGAQITPHSTCKLTSFFVYVGLVGAVAPLLKGALYDSAYNLVALTNEIVPTNGWMELTFASEQTLDSGKDYWFAVWADAGAGDVRVYYRNVGGLASQFLAYGAFPDPLAPAVTNHELSLYANVYDLFTGFAEGWPPHWMSQMGGQGPLTTINCADLIKNLSNFDLNTVGYAEELSGTRVGNVLDDMGWPAGFRDIDVGISSMQASGAIADVKAMTHLFVVQDSELGILYITGDGDVKFEDRHHRLASPHTVSQAVFGDDVGEHYYHGLELEYDDELIFNDIRITRVGGAQQTAGDAASVTAYGARTYSKTGLLVTTDNEALSMADYKLKLYKDPVLMARTLTILGERDPGRLWPKLCGYEISTRITLRLNEASIDEDYFIEGIRHVIDIQNQKWSTTWQLSNASQQVYWLLEVAGFSELELTTYPSY